jgi:hypothetical protein
MGAGWSREENSRVVQENVYDSLAGAYGVVALVALVRSLTFSASALVHQP